MTCQKAKVKLKLVNNKDAALTKLNHILSLSLSVSFSLSLIVPEWPDSHNQHVHPRTG